MVGTCGRYLPLQMCYPDLQRPVPPRNSDLWVTWPVGFPQINPQVLVGDPDSCSPLNGIFAGLQSDMLNLLRIVINGDGLGGRVFNKQEPHEPVWVSSQRFCAVVFVWTLDRIGCCQSWGSCWRGLQEWWCLVGFGTHTWQSLNRCDGSQVWVVLHEDVGSSILQLV